MEKEIWSKSYKRADAFIQRVSRRSVFVGLPQFDLEMGVMRVHLSLGDTVYVSDEKDHGIIEQFVPYGKIIVRLVKKGKVLKLSRGDVKKSRRAE